MLPKQPDPIDIYVGSRVRMRRLVRGMSQEALASKIGVTFQQVQKYEKGTNRISASRLQKVAEVLGVEPNFFFLQDDSDAALMSGIGTVQSSDAASGMSMSKDGLALNQAFLKITDLQVRRSIIALVESLAQARAVTQVAPMVGRVEPAMDGEHFPGSLNS